MDLRRGDIIYVKLLGVNHMQIGTRPCVVVSNNQCCRVSPTLTIIPLTSRVEKKKLPTHKLITNKYLEVPSVALCESITTVDRVLITDIVGRCTKAEMVSISLGILCQVGINILDMIKELNPLPSFENDNKEVQMKSTM